MLKWPVFLKDTDGYVYMYESEKELKYSVEYSDIVNKEYTGWDVNGREVSLEWVDSEPDIGEVVIKETGIVRYNHLKIAITEFAAKHGKLNDSEIEEKVNIVDLYNAVDKKIFSPSKKDIAWIVVFLLASIILIYFIMFADKKTIDYLLGLMDAFIY
ncbi:MAG: hypothetical protein A2044_07400 [Candidatus Firestonebacteria bacterium GWA2_43_8]|nr:MAG: hypothetical protein A2044_07400 [Candidatus Firestonebacteria bacterium GWA2_43_8]